AVEGSQYWHFAKQRGLGQVATVVGGNQSRYKQLLTGLELDDCLSLAGDEARDGADPSQVDRVGCREESCFRRNLQVDDAVFKQDRNEVELQTELLEHDRSKCRTGGGDRLLDWDFAAGQERRALARDRNQSRLSQDPCPVVVDHTLEGRVE